MAPVRKGKLYALTTLQIGDIQSYVSRLFLLVACEGLKLVFLVDNGPWTVDTCRSRPAELWQLMVTKSRMSPFANRRRHCAWEENGNVKTDTGQPMLIKDISERSGGIDWKEDKWLSLLELLNLEVFKRHSKDGAQPKKPAHGLYGCVAFEVAWKDVRGINYINELQTDTCVALEVRNMTKREFDSLEQAQACYATILSGSKDVGPYISVSKLPGGKAGSTIVRCTGQSPSFQGLVDSEGSLSGISERSTVATKVLIGANCRDSRVSAVVENNNQARKRHLEETSWSCEGRARVHVNGEYGRAYVNAVPPRFSTHGEFDCMGSLHPDYFTPPSSPYNGHTFSGHCLNTACQYNDSKKSRIWPSDHPEDGYRSSEELFEDRLGRHSSRKSYTGSDLSLEPPVERRSKGVLGRSQSAGIARNSFDSHRPAGSCARCKLTIEGLHLQHCRDCLLCGTNAEARQERVYVHPDRLIAPAETYRDTLILFRFSEPTLPLELRRIITSDQRLLKMLESGLPPWVIFLQSYPILCNLYRPWMRPLCGTIYYLVSIITVLIGFYDLYKNVPGLKASAAHICGPLVQWIENWGMVSRLKYLGTMLFLQNCEKAFEWSLIIIRTVRHLSMLLMRPILQPLMLVVETVLPLWGACKVAGQTFLQLTSTGLCYFYCSVNSIVQFMLWPFLAFMTTLWNLGVTLFYPVFHTIWTVMILPWQMARLFVGIVAGLSSGVMVSLRDVWNALSSSVQLIAAGTPAISSLQAVKSTASAPSLWRTLWNDIFSKVFHAVHGIVKGLVAFSTACNRHRLSIYNHFMAFLFRMTHMLNSSQYLAIHACRHFLQLPVPDDLKHTSGVSLEEVEPFVEDQFVEDIDQFPSGSSGLRQRSLKTLAAQTSSETISPEKYSSSSSILKHNSC